MVDGQGSSRSRSPRLVERAWRELAGVVERRIPRADFDERDPDYIREQLRALAARRRAAPGR
jgi:hypothetical protein